MITIHFNFALDFDIDLAVDADCSASLNGLNFNVVPSASVGASIDARVSVRLAVVEGGVWVSGQLVQVSTEP